MSVVMAMARTNPFRVAADKRHLFDLICEAADLRVNPAGDQVWLDCPDEDDGDWPTCVWLTLPQARALLEAGYVLREDSSSDALTAEDLEAWREDDAGASDSFEFSLDWIAPLLADGSVMVSAFVGWEGSDCPSPFCVFEAYTKDGRVLATDAGDFYKSIEKFGVAEPM